MRTLNFFMAYLSCISLVLSPVGWSPAAYAADAPTSGGGGMDAQCAAAEKRMISECFEKPMGTTAPPGFMEQIAQSSQGQNQQGLNLSSIASLTAQENARVAGACNDTAGPCVEKCNQDAQNMDDMPPVGPHPNSPDVRKRGADCSRIAQQKSGEYAQQGAALANDAGAAQETADAAKGGGGAGDMLMGGLLGAGLALGAMCLMGSICGEDEDKKDGEDAGGAGDEVVDCATDPNAASHASCLDHFLDQCEANPASAECTDFASHYCGLTDETSGGGGTVNPTSVGSGTGSQFCQIVIATRYCSSGDRETCPSCQNLSRMNSPACESNASVCLPQMTTEDKQMAQVMCPTDPIFSNPLFMADTGSDEGTDDDTTTPPEGTGPSVENFRGDGTTTAAVDGHGALGEVLNGEAASDTLTGIANKYGSRAASAAGHVGSQLSDAAKSSGLVDGVKNFGLAARQIASDIAPSVGPSLFSKVSKVIAQKCQAGEVNNCGPRSFTSN